MPQPFKYDQLISHGLSRAREKFAEQETAEIEDLRLVIFSDQHRGAKTGADDFAPCEETYHAALEHYLKDDFRLVLLGDVEELWECSTRAVIEAYASTLEIEQQFHRCGGYTRIYGNHDDVWTTPLMKMQLEPHICDEDGTAKIHEAVSIKVTDGGNILGELFLTHGHQGTPDSDRFAPLSRFLVRYVWRPLQRVLKIRSNTPSQDYGLRMQHELAMSKWASEQRNLLLITGHTHHPVFPLQRTDDHIALRLEELRARVEKRDLIHEERMRLRDEIGLLEAGLRMRIEHASSPSAASTPRPCYFNAGCCSFADGDITGIEIADREIRLIRWSMLMNDRVARRVVRRANLAELFASE